MEANQMKDIEALQSDYLVMMEVFVLCSADQSLSWVSVCLWAAYGHNREKYDRMTTLNRLIVPDVQACIVLKRQQAVIKKWWMLCDSVRVQSVSTMMNENQVQTDTCPAEMFILGYEILLEFIQTGNYYKYCV